MSIVSAEIEQKPVLLRINQVMAITGEARSTLYRKVQEGTFPKPIKIANRAAAWIESEVYAHNRLMIEQARSK